MNPRIKELSDQAYKNHLKNNQHSSFSPRQDYVKEFSSLIIEECISLVEARKKWVEDQRVFSEHDKSWNQARILQSQQIIEDLSALIEI